MSRSRRRIAFAGCGALVALAGSACDPSRGEPDAEPIQTVVVNIPPPTADIEPATLPSPAEAPAQSPAQSSAGSGEEPGLAVPFADYFDVPSLGTEPVRGSGCGIDGFIGEEMPDGLWRGFVRSFDGLWVDAATSLDFDLACVYAGGDAVIARAQWVDEHPGAEPIDLTDGFLVNDNDRLRTVPMATSFVQVDAQWDGDGRCLPPATLPPSGNTQVYRLLDSWLFVEGGEAQWVLTSCVPR